MNRKIILGVLGGMVALLFAWLLYQSLTFRITGTTPNLSSVSSLSPFMDIHFSKKVSIGNISINSTSVNITGFDNPNDKTLRVYFEELSPDVIYYLTIDNVLADDGKEIKNKTLSFTAKDIPFEKMSKAQRQAILENQDKSTNTKSDPILSHLPYGSLHFQLDANNNEGDLVIEAKLLLTAADAKIDPAAATETYRKEVIEYIKSKDLDPTKYTIEYEVIQPSIY